MTQLANPAPVHDQLREAEVQIVAQAVVAVRPIYNEERNGSSYWECPFCEEVVVGFAPTYEMNDIKHKCACAYVVAKGLVTGMGAKETTDAT